MDLSTELLSADSSTHSLSDTLMDNNTIFIGVSQKKRKILALVLLAKSYKTLNITKRKSSTGRNIMQALDSRSAQVLMDIKSLFGKVIRFIKLDPAKKTMTATIMKVPHPITPADVMDIVPLNDICGLCGGHHRTRICVGKRNTNKDITVPQLQRQSFHSQREIFLPPRCIPEDEKTPATRQEDQHSSQICVANPASDGTNPDTHAPETPGSAIPECTTIALDGRLPENHVYYRGEIRFYFMIKVVYLVQQTNSNHHVNQSASVIYQNVHHHRRSDSPQWIGNKSKKKHPVDNSSAHQCHHTTLCCKHPRLSHFPDNKHKPLNNKFQSPEQTQNILKCP